MSIILQSSGGGSVTIQEPSTASNLTATLPAATGTVMVSGNMPAFSAYKSNTLGTQSITANTYTKVTFDIKDFETVSCFSASRFTAPVAGYYQINAEIDLGGLSTLLVAIFKNGSEYKRGTGTTTGTESYLGVSTLVYMNGSTDYLEVYALSSGNTGSIYATASGQYTWFNGCLVRSA